VSTFFRPQKGPEKPHSNVEEIKVTIMRYISAATAILIFSLTLLAQSGGSFTIEKFVIAGGGGTSDGGTLSVSSTIGQGTVGTTMSGGAFSLEGGFWTSPAATTSTASVTGQVRGSGERYVKNSVVRITGGAVDQTLQSGRYGRFTFNNLPTGITYVIQVTSRRFTYAPVMVEVTSNVSGLIIQPQ
jgi:hypothetical protein